MGASARVYHVFGSGRRDSADDCYCLFVPGLVRVVAASCDTQRLRLLLLHGQCSGLCLQDIVCLQLILVPLGQRLLGQHGSSTPTDRCSLQLQCILDPPCVHACLYLSCVCMPVARSLAAVFAARPGVCPAVPAMLVCCWTLCLQWRARPDMSCWSDVRDRDVR
jgi:hypothetical protein